MNRFFKIFSFQMVLALAGAFYMPANYVVAQESEAAQVGSTLITFNQDIAKIVHDKCASCHRPDQAGPFSLLTYENIAKRAETILAVVDSGYMPPWKSAGHDFAFSDDRRLSKKQIAKLKKWVSDGKPRGQGTAPEPPKFEGGWKLGKPDLVVKMKGQFKIPDTGPDVYRSFVFPLQLRQEKWIKAIEYRPTAKASVHHALFFVDELGGARKLDGADGKPGISGMGFLTNTQTFEVDEKDSSQHRRKTSPSLNNQDDEVPGALEVMDRLAKGLGAYVPGTNPTRLPGDLAMHLPKGSDIVMQTHFHPSGKAEVEHGKLAIYFADKKPSREIVPIQIPAMFGIGVGLKIKAGDSNYRITESFKVPVDIELISIGAHAHYVCREVKMTAKLPDGTKVKLLNINDWDLDWQDRYYFKEKNILPAGTVLTTELVYDNSKNNPENPFSPPREIRWGRESVDEMGTVSLFAVARNRSEHKKLRSGLNEYFLQSLTQGDIVSLLMQLDTNRDGGLQKSEAPPRMASQFSFLDSNKDGKIDEVELQIVRAFLPIFKQSKK